MCVFFNPLWLFIEFPFLLNVDLLTWDNGSYKYRIGIYVKHDVKRLGYIEQGTWSQKKKLLNENPSLIMYSYHDLFV